MRIIVFTDSHGWPASLERIYQKQPNADRYLHLGDGMQDVRYMRDNYPEMNLLSVKGNIDFISGDPENAVLTAFGKKVFYTHGHTFSVKQGLDKLAAYAKGIHADIVLFGHTHTQFYDFVDGIHYLNPGNASGYRKYRFGIVDITEAGVVCVNAEVDK